VIGMPLSPVAHCQRGGHKKDSLLLGVKPKRVARGFPLSPLTTAACGSAPRGECRDESQSKLVSKYPGAVHDYFDLILGKLEADLQREDTVSNILP
jgi:hypothetical protein